MFMTIEHDADVSTVSLYPVKKIDSDYFEESIQQQHQFKLAIPLRSITSQLYGAFTVMGSHKLSL